MDIIRYFCNTYQTTNKMQPENKVIYDKNTIEFVTVAVSYCALIESAPRIEKNDFIFQSLGILPLLYLKALLLPSDIEPLYDEEVEVSVTEEIYEQIKMQISSLMQEDDDYLEVFHPDMPYSDTPILSTISEDLADIYQDIRNFIDVYRHEHPESMNDALYLCKSNFYEYWGQRLVNVQRALHALLKINKSQS